MHAFEEYRTQCGKRWTEGKKILTVWQKMAEGKYKEQNLKISILHYTTCLSIYIYTSQYVMITSSEISHVYLISKRISSNTNLLVQAHDIYLFSF